MLVVKVMWNIVLDDFDFDNGYGENEDNDTKDNDNNKDGNADFGRDSVDGNNYKDVDFRDKNNTETMKILIMMIMMTIMKMIRMTILKWW